MPGLSGLRRLAAHPGLLGEHRAHRTLDPDHRRGQRLQLDVVWIRTRRARLGVSLMFFTNGILFTALLPRYPEVKSAFDLSNTQFGVLVVAFPLGALVAAGLGGRVIRRWGTLRTNALGSIALAVSLAVAGHSPAVWLFAAALVIAGAIDAIVDAAQNVQGVLAEQWLHRSVMNSFHALWSVGAASGGLIGAAAAAAGVPLGVQMTIHGAIWATVAVVACRLSFVPADVRESLQSAEHPGEASVRHLRVLQQLGPGPAPPHRC